MAGQHNAGKETYLDYIRSVRFAQAYTECCGLFAEYSGTLPVSQITKLRSVLNLTHDEFSLVLRLAEGEYHAKRKGKYVEGCLTLREMMEQSTHPGIARRHATQFAGCNHVLELCTGSGTDTRAIAANATNVSTIERNPLYAALAEYGYAQLGICNITQLCGDAAMFLRQTDTIQFDGLWADPERRTEQRRVSTNAHEYQPPLSVIMNVPVRRVKGIKIAPAITLSDAVLNNQWRREWVGYDTDCREQVLWSGTAIQDGTVYVAQSEVEWIPTLNTVHAASIVVDSSRHTTLQYICEPHPCLIRSGHLQEFYAEKSIALLDEHIAYGCSDICTQHPLLTWFHVHRVLPFSASNLQQGVSDAGWNSSTEIKKRGIEQLPDALHKRIRWAKSDVNGTIICCRAVPHSLLFFCTRIL
ncbi:MAG: hypothetical protein JNL32_05695 [Candidatus Kapabacteria bacterium]|nr:hypothetical protein [Candidatus Kapabacteria bacterium]